MINGKFQTIYDNFFFHSRYGLFGLNDGFGYLLSVTTTQIYG